MILTVNSAKISFLILHAICTYHGMTPPQSLPQERETKRINVSDYISNTIQFQLKATCVTKLFFCISALLEALLLVLNSHKKFFNLECSLAQGTSTSATVIVLSCTLATLGGLIRIWCHRSLRSQFTWQMAVRDHHQLITTGPYSVIRHPGYTGWLLMTVGNISFLIHCATPWRYGLLYSAIAIATSMYMSFLMFLLFGRMKKEDKVLYEHFGNQWELWAISTPYALIPWVY